MTPTPITREAVEARVEWLMQMAAVHANEFAAGMEDSADMLLALLARAEKGEEMALFYKNAFRKMEADFTVVCVERDEACEAVKIIGFGWLHDYQHATKSHCVQPKLGGSIIEWAAAELRALSAERDRLAGELRNALHDRDHKHSQTTEITNEFISVVKQRDALTADLAAARETIEGMRKALEPFGAGASLMEADSDDRVVSIGRWHDTDYPRFIADIRVSVADIRRARAALAQANKTEGE